MTIPVIFNPHAGKKRARSRLQSLGTEIADLEMLPTEEPGQAEQFALEAAQQGHAVIVAAGGDGTVHEVANGLLRSGRTDVALGIIPIGSANDYYHSLLLDGHATDASAGCLVDVGKVREPGGKERYFVCCLGLGFNGAVTRESRRIRKLQGVALYGLAALRALWWHHDCPEMTLRLDDQPSIVKPTLMMSVMIGKREGGFLMAPQASIDDGYFDYVHAGALTRWQVVRLLPRLALWGVPASYPGVTQGRCRRIQLKSVKPLTVHADGEFFCQPDDNIREIDVEILPNRLRVFTEIPSSCVTL